MLDRLTALHQSLKPTTQPPKEVVEDPVDKKPSKKTTEKET